MRILLTGGAGFIGFHLTKQLLCEGHTVVAIDNLSPYYDVSIKKDRLKQLEREQGWEFRKMDILDREQLLGPMQEHRFDMVVHLAAIAGVAYGLDHGDEYIQTNELGTYFVLDAMRKAGI